MLPKGRGGLTRSNAVRKVIDQRLADITKAYAAGDVESVVEVFAEHCVVMPLHLEPFKGRSALRAFWNEAFAWGTGRFTFHTEDVVVSGRTAVERGAYTHTFSHGPGAPPGMGASEVRGNYVVR